MAKKVKKIEQKNLKLKNKNQIYKIIVSCAIILLLALLSGLVFKKLTVKENGSNTETQNESFSFYDSDRCRCLERERLRCNEGFELDEEKRLCRNGNEITNVILACSKYECSGIVYEFNFEDEIWEMK